MDTRNKKNPIAGYMGYIPSHEQEGSDPNQAPTDSHIPGYVGYIPAVKSENLFGKTYGKITEDCSKGQYSRGIEMPKDVKYNSTTKSTYKQPGTIKDQEAKQGKMSGVKLSTFRNAANLVMNANRAFGNRESGDSEPQTSMTYEEACRHAYNN